MTFSSPSFLFGFLPLVYFVFHVLIRRGSREAALHWLLAASLIFYGWDQPSNLWVLAASICANFFFARQISEAGRFARPGSAKRWLWAGIAANVVLLAFFKIQLAGISASELSRAAFNPDERIFIPLAISFITFQQIALLVDIHAGLQGPGSFSRHALFISFFPQLVMGPIVHYRDINPQFEGSSFMRRDPSGRVVGALLLTTGLAKKLLLAQALAPFVISGFARLEAGSVPTFLDAWILAVAWQFQLYFDFSGYADMAVGLGKLFNVELPINFDSPFLSRSRLEFWRRWHISFGDFMRRYVFSSLSRVRSLPFGQMGAFSGTLVIGGLWHGISPTFIVWGLVNALALAAAHAWGRFRRGAALRRSRGVWSQRGAVAFSFALTSAIGVLFRSRDLESAFRLYAGMAGVGGIRLPHSIQGLVGGAAGEGRIYSDLWVSFRELPALAACATVVFLLPNTQDFFSGVWTAADQRPTRPDPPRLSAGMDLARGLRFSFRQHWAFLFAMLLIAGLLNLESSGRFIYNQF